MNLNNDKERELSEKLKQAQADIAVITEAVDPDDIDTAATKLAAAHATEDAIKAAIAKVREQRKQVFLQENRLKAADLRKQAGEKRADGDSRLRRRSELLERLCEIEDIALDRAAFERLCLLAGPAPKSVRLASETEALERQAAELERAPAPVDGFVDVENATLDSLVAAVLAHRSVGPKLSDVARWWIESEARLLRLNPSATGRPLRVRLRWKNSQIVEPQRLSDERIEPGSSGSMLSCSLRDTTHDCAPGYRDLANREQYIEVCA